MSQKMQLDQLRTVTEDALAPTTMAPEHLGQPEPARRDGHQDIAILATEPVEPNAPEGAGDHPLKVEKEDLFDRMRRIFFERDVRQPA